MTGEWLAYCAACPVPEIANVFNRARIPFHQVTGMLDEDPVCWNEVADWIEAARVAMTRSIKRGGKVWIRLFPDKPITKKPAETRMGKGKGAPEQWVAVVRPGKILFEMEGVDRGTAEAAMRLAAHKLPIKTKFISREEAELGA